MGLGIGPLILSFGFNVWSSGYLGASQIHGIGAWFDMGVLVCFFPVDTMDEGVLSTRLCNYMIIFTF